MTQTLVNPISDDQKNEVIRLTCDYIEQASYLWNRTFPQIPIAFDMKGKCAGMYRVKNQEKVIRYNPYIFSKYYEDSLNNTVPHEVAHYITDSLYGRRGIRPHGKEWQGIMAQFGKEPRVTSQYDLSGIPVRQYRYFEYRCACSSYQLTQYRHSKTQKGLMQYYCRKCQTLLTRDAGSNQ